MSIHGARAIIVRHRESLFHFLDGVFGDPVAAEKFSRFTIQRFEAEAGELDAVQPSILALFRFAREICQDYLSLKSYHKTAFAAGDEAAPQGAIPEALLEPAADNIPAQQRVRVVLSLLPCPARLIVRLLVIERVAIPEIEKLFRMTPGHLGGFVGRLRSALGRQATLAMLAQALAEASSSVPQLDVAGDLPAPGVDPLEPGRSVSEVREEAVAARPVATPCVAAGDARAEPGAPATASWTCGSQAGERLPEMASPRARRAVALRREPARLAGGGALAGRSSSADDASHPALRSFQWATPFTRPFPGARERASLVEPTSLVRRAIAVLGLVGFVAAAWVPLRAGHTAASTPVFGSTPVRDRRVEPAPERIGTLEQPRGSSVPVVTGQEIVAPIASESHLVLHGGLEAWLAAGSRASVTAGRIEMREGVARLSVRSGCTALAAAGEMALQLTAGEYVLRGGPGVPAALASLTGAARVVAGRAVGLRVDRGRYILAEPGAGSEVRDLGARPEQAWGACALAVASATHSARPVAAPASAPASGPVPGVGPVRAAPTGSPRGYQDFL
ncbi:MAG: hypothetical protein HY815_23380 [Candidatus Riflebacteria bacterium]|nr:hypothetical protein [Candidatus Riflebacteria bacterium]